MTTLSSASGATPAGTTGASNAPERARLHQAAQAFEAIFVRQMLSSARETNFGDTLWGDDKGQDTFTAMRDERFADIAAQSGSLGLGSQVEKQLSGQISTPTGTTAPTAPTGGARP